MLFCAAMLSCGLSGGEAGQDGADAARIPLGERPGWVDRPERWRYLPESRLLGGDPFGRFFVSSFMFPILTFEEATGAGLGAGAVDIEPFGNRRRYALGAFALRTTGGLESYRGFWQLYLAHHELPQGGVIYEERTAVSVDGGYQRNPVRRYYGPGGRGQPGDETSYTDETGELRLAWRGGVPRADGDVAAGASARMLHRNLAPGKQPGRPSTAEVHPGAAAAADGTDALWLGGSLRYDVRDSEANPYRGFTAALEVDAAPAASRGGEGGIATLSAVGAIGLPGAFHDGGAAEALARGPEENPPTDVLALGGFVRAAWGDLPFPDLPALGGSRTLRGYIADRFTGEACWHATAEWRLWVLPRGVRFGRQAGLERIGLAPFADAGAVAEDPAGLRRAKVRRSLGVGLRAMLQRDVIFRLDVARSPEQLGVNFDFGYTF